MFFKDIKELNQAVENGAINTPQKAIAAKCLDCSAYQQTEVRECPTMSCPLWQFRNGKNPYRKTRKLTDEEKAAAAVRLKNARDAKSVTKN